jgi:hypothetical protein
MEYHFLYHFSRHEIVAGYFIIAEFLPSSRAVFVQKYGGWLLINEALL